VTKDTESASRYLALLARTGVDLAHAHRLTDAVETFCALLQEQWGASLGYLYIADSFANLLRRHGGLFSPALKEGLDASFKLPMKIVDAVTDGTEKAVLDERFPDEPVLQEIKKRLPSEHRLIGVPLPDGKSLVRGCLIVGVSSEMAPFMDVLASMISQVAGAHRKLVMEKEELVDENYHLREELKSRYHFDNIIGFSGAMQEVYETTAMVAKSRASVLIQGESGTGKELIAHAIHYHSARANHPFIKINCGALSESLLESELFGHVKGSFTGAIRDRKGIFESAHNGTVFLDEVAEMSSRLQVKLLRVLQEREFERVGDTKTIAVDVRIIAATNKDLEKTVKEGLFREDLYYRLAVIPVMLPPLRARREDIGPLLEHFLGKHNRENFKNVVKIPKAVIDVFSAYDWPGNVRELENCVERMVVLSHGPVLEYDLLPLTIRASVESGKGAQPRSSEEDFTSMMLDHFRIEMDSGHEVYKKVVGRLEKILIQEMLKRSGNVRRRAAEILGINRNTLHEKIKQLKVSVGSRKKS